MIIRPEQMEVFQQQIVKEFERLALDHLRTELTEITDDLTDQELCARIRDCVPRAELYGLEDQDELLAFIDSTYLLDDLAFDTNPSFPWAQRILKNKYLDSQEKADELLDRAFSEHQSMSGD